MEKALHKLVFFCIRFKQIFDNYYTGIFTQV